MFKLISLEIDDRWRIYLINRSLVYCEVYWPVVNIISYKQLALRSMYVVSRYYEQYTNRNDG